MPKSIAHRFIRLPEVANIIEVSKGTIYNWMNAVTFQKSI
ncbi:helix-turn-helix transcriptional regulator [Prochlorococcus sp. MIT 1300]